MRIKCISRGTKRQLSVFVADKPELCEIGDNKANYLFGVVKMERTILKAIWKEEEKAAHIHGWDFFHIHGRYEEEMDLPWDYGKVIRQYLRDDMDMLDYDTGGGEFLLSLRHPFHRTAATEGYRPNVELCEERLLPLGIAFRECDDPAMM